MTHQDGHRITDVAHAKQFVFAGKAIFTLKSAKSGKHITFKVKKPQTKSERGPSHFVSVLDHADGTGGYSYLGVISGGRFELGRKSPYCGQADAPQVTGAAWLFAQLMHNRLPDQCELWHEGRCGRCGRRLTVPESIASGIGPECAQKEGS